MTQYFSLTTKQYQSAFQLQKPSAEQQKGCFPHWTLVEVLRDAATNLTFYEPVYDCACCVFYAN
jgi:hypothetical protein